jgi:hypothetical protein
VVLVVLVLHYVSFPLGAEISRYCVVGVREMYVDFCLQRIVRIIFFPWDCVSVGRSVGVSISISVFSIQMLNGSGSWHGF